MFGGFSHYPDTVVRMNRNPKPTKKNIKQLIEDEKKVSSF